MGSEVKSPFAKRLEKAVAHNQVKPKRRSFLVTYHKQSSGRVVRRRIDPLAIKGSNVVAYDHKRKAIRSFKMDRIKHMEKSAFWQGFEKKAGGGASALGKAIDAGSLVAMMVPSVMHMAGKPMDEKKEHAIHTGALAALTGTTLLGGKGYGSKLKGLAMKALRKGK